MKASEAKNFAQILHTFDSLIKQTNRESSFFVQCRERKEYTERSVREHILYSTVTCYSTVQYNMLLYCIAATHTFVRCSRRHMIIILWQFLTCDALKRL